MTARWAEEVFSVVEPVVEGRHDEIDELGRLPDDVVEAMHRSGLFRTWIPAEFDGRDSTLAEGLEVIEEMSRLDSGVGWVTMINMTTSWLAGSIDRDEARAIFSDPRGVMGGTTAPTGKAISAPGGLRVTGQWAWGSGIHASNWMACAAMLDDAVPRPVLAIIPIEEIEILDTWQVSGMKGSGSTDYRANDVFVPETRVIDLVNLRSWSDRPFHQFAVFGLLALAVSSVAVGLGRRALSEFRQIAAERTLLGTSKSIATSPVAQTSYAQAEAAVLSASALKDRTIETAWLEACEGPLSVETRRQLRLAATNCAFSTAHAINLLWEVAGAGVVYNTSHMQRLHRDIHVLTQHFRVANRTWEMCGAVALDQPFDGQL